MLRVLVYSFATVAILLCIAAVGFYIYVARPPVKEYVDRGKKFVEENEGIAKGAKEVKRALDELKRLADLPQSDAPTPEPVAPMPEPTRVPEAAARPEPAPLPEITVKPKKLSPPAPVRPASPAVEKVEPAVQPGTLPVLETTIYKVKKNDTLYGIAKKFYNNSSLWKKIAAANGIEAPYVIYPGRKLKIPPTQAATPVAAPSSRPAKKKKTTSPRSRAPIYLTGGRGL